MDVYSKVPFHNWSNRGVIFEDILREYFTRRGCVTRDSSYGNMVNGRRRGKNTSLVDMTIDGITTEVKSSMFYKKFRGWIWR